MRPYFSHDGNNSNPSTSVPSQNPPLQPNFTQWPPEAQEAYRLLQQSNQQAVEEAASLKRQNEDLNQNTTRKKSRAQRGQELIADKTLREAVSARGQIFLVIRQDPDELDSEDEDEGDNKHLVERYRSALPSALRDRFMDASVANTFASGMGATRSNFMTRLRNGGCRPVLGPTLYGLLEAYRSEPNEELLKVQGWEDGKFNHFGPFMFEEGHEDNNDYLFDSIILKRALRCCLFGPTSLRPDSRPGEDTLGKVWQVKEVTPGSMAFAATAIRYVLSKDTEFSMTGNITKFDYLASFKIYKEAAELLGKTIRGREVIKSWNEFVFQGIGLTNEEPASVNTGATKSVLELLRRQANEDAVRLEGEEADAATT